MERSLAPFPRDKELGKQPCKLWSWRVLTDASTRRHLVEQSSLAGLPPTAPKPRIGAPVECPKAQVVMSVLTSDRTIAEVCRLHQLSDSLVYRWKTELLAALPAISQPDPVGLHSFATLSTAETIENPRSLRIGQKALAKVQHKHSKLEKGSRERRRHRKAVARVHERIAFRRANHTHQHSRRMVNRFGVIAVEDLGAGAGTGRRWRCPSGCTTAPAAF